MRSALPPSFDLVTPIPNTQLQQMFNEGNGWGVLAYEKALYLNELSDEAINVFIEHLPRKKSPLSLTPVFALGGAYAQVPEDAIAFGGQRNAGYLFNIAAVCPDLDSYAADREWVRSFWDALRPHAMESGSYVNFMAEYEEERVRSAFGETKYDRLSKLKARYDPNNIFRLNPNIKPA